MVRPFIFILTLLCLCFPVQDLQAQTCPGNIEGSGITSVADQVWSSRIEARISEVSDGFALADSAVSGRFQSFNIEGTPEFSLSDRGANEYSGSATLAFELGGLASARRELLSAEKDSYLAEKLVQRWVFIDEVQDRYIAWRTHERERLHLQEYVNEAASELEPIQAARTRMLVSKLDLADLEVEFARINAELAEATRSSSHARARLFALLGMECKLPEVKKGKVPKDNPWKALLENVLDFPQVKRLEYHDKKLAAEAELLRVSSPWVVNAGLALRSTNDAFHFGPILSLTIPLQTNKAQAHLSKARSVASRLEKQQTIQRIEVELVAEGKNFDSLRAQYASLGEQFMEPLRERAQLFEAAFKASQIQLHRLIRARRELHEGEHKMLLKSAEIEAQVLKSIAIAQLLKSTEKNK